MRPRLLDGYSCSGGAARGYKLAGWRVTGCDLRPQPRYQGDDFIEGDFLALDPEWIAKNFDAVHASPPCQALSELTPDKSRHVNLIGPTRDLLEATGLPYVLENVRAARSHLRDPVSLFGTMFGNSMTTSRGQTFVLSRERLFETNWPLEAPMDPGAGGLPIANVYGGHLRCRSAGYRTGGETGRTVDFEGEDRPALARELMEMPWATMGEMSEAIPPSYCHFVGERLLAYLASR